MNSPINNTLPYLVDSQRMARALRESIDTLIANKDEIVAATKLTIDEQQAKRPFIRAGEARSTLETAVRWFDVYLGMQQNEVKLYESSEKAWVSDYSMRLMIAVEQGTNKQRLVTRGISRFEIF